MSELIAIFEEALELERTGKPGVLATLVDVGGSTPRHDVARMIIRGDGTTMGTVGGGQMEHQVVQKATEVIAAGVPTMFETTLSAVGMICGGKVRVMLEPLGASPKMVLFGGGHVAADVAPIAAQCGFKVAVVDDRPEWASTERFPMASQLVHSFDPEEWGPLNLGNSSYCVVVTRGHEHDFEVVRALLGLDLAYLGMIGSSRKVAKTRERLAESGIAPEVLETLHSPIGVPINSETPAEIAVSIMAEIIDVRRKPAESSDA